MAFEKFQIQPPCPTSESSGIALVTATPEAALRVEAMSSRIAHPSTAHALHVNLAVRRSDETLDMLERANAIINERRV